MSIRIKAKNNMDKIHVAIIHSQPSDKTLVEIEVSATPQFMAEGDYATDYILG